MHRRHYSEEEKNAVISRYAAGGEEVKSMLAEYGIPKSTFNQWLREYDLRYGCESKYDFTPRNFRSILKRNDHLEDLISVMQASYCSPTLLHLCHTRSVFAESDSMQGQQKQFYTTGKDDFYGSIQLSSTRSGFDFS